MSVPLSPWRARLASWRAKEDGVAAVEFALLAGFLLLLMLGSVEITRAIANDRKLVLVSRSVADLTARAPSPITTSWMGNIFAAATAVMVPYDASRLRLVVSSVNVTKVGSAYVGTVGWSCAKGPAATARLPATAYTVPAGFQTSATSFVLVEAVLPYRPLYGATITGPINMTDTSPWPIRNVSTIAGPTPCPPN